MRSNEFGYLKKPVPDNLKITILKNKSCPFAEKDGRSLSQQRFEKVSTNGEIVTKKWLLYFPYRQAYYCLYLSYFQKSSSLQTLTKKKVSPLGESQIHE